MKIKLLAASAVVALIASCTTVTENKQVNVEPAVTVKAEQVAQTPELGEFGLDMSVMDVSVKPGNDFYRYVNGKWLDSFEIPADRTSYGSFTVLSDRSEKQVRAIIQDAAKANAASGSMKQKIGDLYASFMDQESINAKGLSGLQSDLDLIAAASTHYDIVRQMARRDMAANRLFGGFVNLDSKNPTAYAYYMSHAGLGLPNRDYYLDQDERSVSLREGYQAHIANMLTLANIKDAAAKAETIFALETKIAKAHWDKLERRNRDLTYNKMTLVELEEFAPGYPWALDMEVSGADVTEMVLRENTAFPVLAKLFADTSVADWKDYLTFHLLSSNSANLPTAFDEENFAFFGKQLSGQQEMRDRWKRAVALVNRSVGEAVGQVYVERHFPPASKKQMDELVVNLRIAVGQRIDGLAWMSDDTKVEAHAKLAAFTPKIGYPDRWKDYSSMSIDRDDLLANTKAARVWQWNDQISNLGKPIDKSAWFMNPQRVNAYYSPTRNEIVFPAAILQAPFFDPAADPAINYGGIGAVIGHEIGHGFDDQGSKSDGTGKLRNWWTDEDKAAFEARTGDLGEQYSQFSPLEGHYVNGKFTMGENIGDLGGLTFALNAYRISLNGQPSPVLHGLTGEQRLFMAWAQVWRAKYRDEAMINRLKGAPHSPPEYRTNGVVRNIDAWYEAFDIKEGDAMYLPPEKRVRIW
ncbi:MAG: M13 family peptidase [Robiginitomaculum sp.]|nr:M13 family peptidase [Robiginitomaculum sp.]